VQLTIAYRSGLVTLSALSAPGQCKERGAHDIAYLYSSTAASKTTAPGPTMFHGLNAWYTTMRKMNTFLSLSHWTRRIRSIPKCAVAEVVCWEMYSRIHQHLLRLMKNEPGIRLASHRLSRLEIMPSHHAMNILQQNQRSRCH
jgi:hypothetical protein